MNSSPFPLIPIAPDIRNELAAILDPKRILTRPIDLIAFASDASFYRLLPKAVVLARGIEEIQALFRFSHKRRIPITFRAAGTSLSGQAITDGILVEVARNWRNATVEENGNKVRVQPGVIGGHVNRMLASCGAKIGPDPASIDACMMGGILANNSSGMCCGVTQNAYHTLESLTFVLPSGTVIDTAEVGSDLLFQRQEPKLAEGLLDLKKSIHGNPTLYERIRYKYQMKNTTGYSLNALIDFERSVDIFQHLLIGSEGTLGFIAEAVLKTVPDLPVKYTGLLLFQDLYAACAAIAPLHDAGAQAIELMDRAALRSVQDQQGAPSLLGKLPPEAAAMLVEFQSGMEVERQTLEFRAKSATARLRLVSPAVFTHVPSEQALLWKIRKGLFPSAGAVRQSGTSVILEDVVFPLERLADAILELKAVFAKHGYTKAIIFGHAKDGNFHFVISQSFNDQEEIDRYSRLMDDVVRLVVDRFDGSLKGEHGTGRNMAPFVEAEWGAEAFEIMKRLKLLADPENLLNPGVIINSDSRAHVTNLKTLPSIEPEVDKCTECGYCEVHCPSRDLTLTPRQRIIVQREMKRLKNGTTKDREIVKSLDADFQYMVLDTCAVDGLCALACPVGIDTGALTKRLRQASHSSRSQGLAQLAAEQFSWVEQGVRLSLRAGHLGQSVFGANFMRNIIRGANKLTGQRLPLWMDDMPQAASVSRPRTEQNGAHAVYFPSCISRTMGFLPGEPTDLSIVQAFVAVSSRANLPIFIPKDIEGTCCGLPFSSKGYDRAYRFAVNRAITRFWRWSDGGRLSIVIDTTPCSYGLLTSRSCLTPENQKRFDAMKLVDGVTFAHDELLPRLKVSKKSAAVALHPVCSLVKMNLTTKLEGIARACSQTSFIAPNAGCCGFAGDRGFLIPELTEEATRQESAEICKGTFDGYFSSSRTCELAMSRSTGHAYRSHICLLEEATRS